ncbi:hypothetical protein NL676_021407 [Syzygium grande]|nr:hypothetical protein NL676_021407 [Syzygium grande]
MAIITRKLHFIIERLKHKSPKLAPRGCFAVYVGEDEVRYEVPLEFLECQSFQDLLRDELVSGCDRVKLLCSEEDFDEVLHRAKAECKEAKRIRRRKKQWNYVLLN